MTLVEIVGKRTEKSKTFSTDKPNTFRVRAYGGPMHYEDAEGNYQDIDLTLEDVNPGDPGYAKGYRWRCVKTKIRVYLKPDVFEDNAIAAEYDGAKVGFSLRSVAYLDIDSKDYTVLSQANTVTPTIGTRDVTWGDVLPHVDYKFQWGKARGKIEIVLKQDNLPDPADYGYDPDKTYLVFIEKIETSLKTWVGDSEENGDCEAENRISLKTAGELKYLLPVGNAVDAGGEEVKARYKIVRKDGNTFLLIGIPYSWLKDPQRQWPIVIDPTYTSTTADGYMENYVNDTWTVCRDGTDATDLYAGETILGTRVTDSGAGWRGIRRIFSYYDTSAIPGVAMIDSVDLLLYGQGTQSDHNVSAQKGTQADTLGTADFDALVGTTGEGDPDGREYGHTSIVDNDWNTIGFNQTGKDDIVKDGTTKVCCRDYDYDYLDSAPGSGEDLYNNVSAAEESGEESYLDIEYTVAAAPRHGFVNFQDPGVL